MGEEYRLSMDKMQREGVLLCLIGPAGVGKTTISKRLVSEVSGVSFSISATSRAPREGERNNVDYHFLSPDEFKIKIKNDELFEWEEVHGNFYGTLRNTVDGAVGSGIDLILDIDIRGALRFKNLKPKNVVIVFILPPSIDELKSRLHGRGTIDESELKRRYQTARTEFSGLMESIDSIDFIVINDQLELAYQTVKGILLSERSRANRANGESLKKFVNSLKTIG